MIIRSAKFLISNSTVDKCPDSNLPEYAFIGRSNVGKSSLINMLAQNKKLAMTSATPGKTMLINQFLINDSWHIVDLPGYGYVKKKKKDREALQKMIESYVLKRKQMTNLFVLIDIRHAPQKNDLEFITWLGMHAVPFSIIFTKADKLKATVGTKMVEAYKSELLKQWDELPPIFVSSSLNGAGRDEILNYIESINKQIARQ